MIAISGVRKSFGARILFDNVTLNVGARDRVAIVGPNGAGKTTLFEMVAGAQTPDAGTVKVLGDAVVGYLRQETDDLRGRSVLAEVMSAGQAMTDAGHRLHIIEEELEADPENEELLHEFIRLQERFDALGGWTLESEAKRICTGLGFRDRDMERQTDGLSGGWLMRVALAKLLLASPDILLLDEPTNHLDVESVDWLEHFLTTYEGAVLLISHDRDFINGFATKVAEITDARLDLYHGDYEAFVEQREERMRQAAAAAANQAKRVAEIQQFIDRFRYKASKARQVQSRIKMLGKMEKFESGPSARKRTMKLGFPPPPRPGRVALTLSDIDFSYPNGEKVYTDLNLQIERGEKVALVGPNGAGKTTLLKLCAGVLEAQGGERELGHNVNLGYFAQHQIEALNPRNRVIEELQRAMPPGTNLRARDLLGRFLFTGDDIDKPVSVLSGGERTRLALARLLVSPFNVLCMDEPTNHLDIQSRDVLEDALDDYEGVLILITHDRHLIRSVANRIVEVVAGHVRNFPGDYESYLHLRERVPVKPVEPEAPKPARKVDSRDKRKAGAEARKDIATSRQAIRKVEDKLSTATERVKQLSDKLADADFYAKGGDEVANAVKEFEKAQERVAELEREWERLAVELEGA